MSTLISIPAGRCSRRSPDTKWIDPQPDKGSIEMRFEDELMHLCECGVPDELCHVLNIYLCSETDEDIGWKTRDSGTVEDVSSC